MKRKRPLHQIQPFCDTVHNMASVIGLQFQHATGVCNKTSVDTVCLFTFCPHVKFLKFLPELLNDYRSSNEKHRWVLLLSKAACYCHTMLVLLTEVAKKHSGIAFRSNLMMWLPHIVTIHPYGHAPEPVTPTRRFRRTSATMKNRNQLWSTLWFYRPS
jgi:hypothetical protein